MVLAMSRISFNPNYRRTQDKPLIQQMFGEFSAWVGRHCHTPGKGPILEQVHTRLPFAIPLVAILGVLSLLHVYWAVGGRWASAFTVPTVSGRRMFDPSPLATWLVAALLGTAVMLVIGKAAWMGSGPLSSIFQAGVWGLSLVFLLRAIGNLRSFGFFKTVKETPFAHWDTWLYSPLSILLAVLAAALARADS